MNKRWFEFCKHSKSRLIKDRKFNQRSGSAAGRLHRCAPAASPTGSGRRRETLILVLCWCRLRQPLALRRHQSGDPRTGLNGSNTRRSGHAISHLVRRALLRLYAAMIASHRQVPLLGCPPAIATIQDARIKHQTSFNAVSPAPTDDKAAIPKKSQRSVSHRRQHLGSLRWVSGANWRKFDPGQVVRLVLARELM